jgi:hypothetical protein
VAELGVGATGASRTLRKFFQQHNCRSAEKTEERIAAIYQATSANHPGAQGSDGLVNCLT